MKIVKKGWKEIPIGGVILEAGNASNYNTGDWRSQRPIWEEEKCIHCLLCYVYCPDSSIEVEDKKMTGIDYFYCKGCGICADICPKDAIEITPETKASESETKISERSG